MKITLLPLAPQINDRNKTQNNVMKNSISSINTNYSTNVSSLPIHFMPLEIHFGNKAYTNAPASRVIRAGNYIENGANYNKENKELIFKIVSPNATDVTLCLFDEPMGKKPVKEIAMKKISSKGGVFRASQKIDEKFLNDRPVYYGFRVFGPNWQKAPDFVAGKSEGAGFINRFDKETGFRFNPNKVIADPRSPEWSHNPDKAKNPEIFLGDDDNYLKDSSTQAPKSVFKLNDEFYIPKVKTKRSLCDEKYIAEVHLKDLTALVEEGIKSKRGTFLAAKEHAQNLKKMGISMVELLPLNEFSTDPEHQSDLKNYWGYMPISFFALHKEYGNGRDGETLNEFRQMIEAFHEEDIKVCMDVVYNHSGETHPSGRYYSLSGIGDETFHKQNKTGGYRDNTGCGNDYNVTTVEGQNLVADAVAFFAKQGVDAFRFDLAAAFMDVSKDGEAINYDHENINNLAKRLPLLLEKRGIKVDKPSENNDGINLIAEPWNASFTEGNKQYQAGNFPQIWAEWSDVSREMFKKDSYQTYYMPQRDLRDLFEGFPDFYKKSTPINYISSHDGHTLNDINTKYHIAWSDKVISVGKNEQENNIKKQLALLFLSRPTPMIQLGDLIGHSKRLEHNTYNQDNELNYLDYSKAMDKNCEPKNTRKGRIYDFTKNIAEFRALRPSLYTRQPYEGVTYYEKDGSIIEKTCESYFDDKENDFFSLKIVDNKNKEDVIFIATTKVITKNIDESVSAENKHSVAFELPQNTPGKKWHRVLDSSRRNLKVSPKGETTPVESGKYRLNPNGVAVFIEK